jgi:predicted nucleic acid-binding protein
LKREDAEAIRDIAWACVDNMSELGTPVGADESDLWLARKYRRLHPDLEDDLVLAAAERAQADYLVTSDEALLRKAMVPALSPEDFVRVVCAA